MKEPRIIELKKKITDEYRINKTHLGPIKKDVILMRNIAINVILEDIRQMIEELKKAIYLRLGDSRANDMIDDKFKQLLENENR